MRKQQFGHSQVSVIGLGTGEFGGSLPEGKAREFMDAYVALGGNFLDTARVYGDFRTPKDGESEKVIGRWMADRRNRENIFLSTKGGHPRLASMQVSRLSPGEIRGDLENSLEALQTDHVDIFWLHRDDETRPVGQIMETLHSLVEEGKTRLIGVSNWRPARIREANAYAASHGLTGLAANQPQFSLAVQVQTPDATMLTMDRETYRLHKETGMACCCFSSQAHGFFSKLDEGGEAALKEGVKREFLNAENLAVYTRLKALQKQTGYSVGALSIAFLTCQPFPAFALVGASRMAHIEALAEAGEAVLSDAQRESLRSLA